MLTSVASAQFQATTPLPQPLLSHTAVTLNGRIYVAGGISDSGSVTGGAGYLNNIYYCATMNADGTLGAWQAASPMPEFLGLGMHAAAAYNGRLYVLGGTNLLGPRNVVYFSGVNTDGTLTGWQPTTPMPQKVGAHSAAVYGGRIYVTGGLARSIGATAITYSAPINADGTVGAWRDETPLPSTLFGHKSFARADRLFVLGGSAAPYLYGDAGVPADAISSQVYAAAINADGTLGAWQAQEPLPAQMDFFALVDTEKSVYLLGGFDGGVLNSVHFSPIAADGTLGAWQALQALPQNLLSLAAVATPDYLYSIGGGQAYIDGPQSAVYFAAIKAQLKAFVRITPHTLNRRSHGRYVTAIVGLPEADVRNINPDTVRISAVNGTPITPIYAEPSKFRKRHQYENSYDDRDEDDDPYENETDDHNFRSRLSGHRFAVFKFDRQDLQDVVAEGTVTIKLEGSLTDARNFSGENTNWVILRGKARIDVAKERPGFRRAHSGAGVNISKGAFQGNPDLLLTVENEDEAALAKEEKEKREKDKKEKRIDTVSNPVEFGPHGMTFEQPVTISLPYSSEKLPAGADEAKLKVAYWNQAAGEWEILASVVSTADKLVSADVGHFSVYQIMSEAVPSAEPAPAPAPAGPVFAIGDVYVFPNPALSGAAPKLHIAATAGDRASVKVYSVSGRLVYETSYAGAPVSIDGALAYELELRGQFTSGVYYYQAEAASGAQKFKKSGKFAVVR